jgi:hypothetical protein
MRYHQIMLACAWLASSAALAQTPTPTGSADDWVLQPAAASSSDYRSGLPGVPGAKAESPFRFSDGSGRGLLDKPPPQPTDRDFVLGTGRAWLGGRPPLDCAVTPHDPRCH